jgi:hydroxypyruvate isomerase
MKLAANISLLFQELTLLDRFQAARDAGFAAVELQFPYAHDAHDLAKARERAGVEIVLINAPVLADLHPAGFACRPELQTQFAACLAQVADYADALDVRQVNVLAGCSADDDDRAALLRVLRDNLQRAQDYLAPRGVAVLIELVNSFDVQGYVIDDPAIATQLIEASGGAIGLQFDLYHFARMGFSPARSLAALLPLVRHVQFADAPGRHQPGTGTIAFDEVLQILAARGYRRWIGAEYRPSGETRDSFGWMKDWRMSVSCLQ